MIGPPVSARSSPPRCCVVVTYNSAGAIAGCLEALAGETVIVVDNASSDSTASLVQAAAAKGRVRLVALPENLGFARAANIGFRLAAPDDVVLVNPDAVPEPGSLDRLARTAAETGAGLVAPRLLYTDGELQESARTFPGLAPIAARRTPFGRLAAGQRRLTAHLAPTQGSGVRRVDWVIGALMYIPRRSLDAVGGFDERFFLYGEDVDLCTRLWAAGRPVMLDTEATATHAYGRASLRTFDLRQRETRLHWLAIGKLALRHPGPFWLGRPVQRVATNTVTAEPTANEIGNVRFTGRPHVRGEVPLAVLATERAWQMAHLYDNWPSAVADRLGLLRKDEIRYRVRRSFGRAELVARANGCDVRTITEVWIGELYTALLPDRTERGALVVDIGANCGYFAVYAGLRLPGARIVCFEPEPANRDLAERNLALNGIDAVVRPTAVVHDNRTAVDLYLSNDPRLHTTIVKTEAVDHGIDAERYNDATVAVPAVNINDALRPLLENDRISLLKIDVEGLDLDLIDAIEDDVLAGIDYLVAETEDRDTTAVAIRLKTAGFSVREDMRLLAAVRDAE